MPRCRDCKLYDLDAVKSKSGAVLSHKAGQYLWVSKEQIPASIGFRYQPAKAGWMEPNLTHNCRTFQKVGS